MLGKRANKSGGGVAEQGKIIVFDRVGRTETTMTSRLFAPPKLFLATADDDGEVAVPEHHAEAVMSPASILQAGSPTSSAACHVLSGGGIPFSHGEGKSRRRPWEARPVGLGLAGALTGEATGAATSILTGQTLRPVHTINALPSCLPSPVAASKEFVGVNSCWNPAFADPVGQHLARRCLSPGEKEASEDYTRVIARGPNARTVHIFDDHVGVHSDGMSAGAGEGEFLRWCHGCSKDLGQGKDIFMYRGEVAFCSHECRYRKMLFDENSDAD